MNPCDVSLLSRYLDAELTLPERRAAEIHIAQCSVCRSELEAMRQMDHLFRAWSAPREPLPAATDRRIHASIAKRSRLSSVLAFSRFMPAAVGSSVAALLVLITVNMGGLAPSSLATRQEPGPSRSLLEKRSAPLVNARRVSAILGSRAPAQEGDVPWRHGNVHIE